MKITIDITLGEDESPKLRENYTILQLLNGLTNRLWNGQTTGTVEYGDSTAKWTVEK